MAALNPEMVERRRHRLGWRCNRFLAVSFDLVPKRVRQQWRGNIALDATAMPVWGRRGSTSRFKDDDTGAAVSPEPLAGWYARSTDTHQDPSDGGRPKVYQATWAYECHIAMACATKAGDDDFPMLALAMTLDAPAGRVGQNGAALLAGVAEQGHPIGLAVSDRAYMPGAKPETFQLPARALGYRLVMDDQDDRARHAGDAQRRRSRRRILVLSRHPETPRRRDTRLQRRPRRRAEGQRSRRPGGSDGQRCESTSNESPSGFGTCCSPRTGRRPGRPGGRAQPPAPTPPWPARYAPPDHRPDGPAPPPAR